MQEHLRSEYTLQQAHLELSLTCVQRALHASIVFSITEPARWTAAAAPGLPGRTEPLPVLSAASACPPAAA